jgi:glycosyltransferase involved in cell wall biosynthesis
MKKVLIITYYWPPSGGPGVQRVLKFAKYLPEFGWKPIILTVRDGEYPQTDSSLCQEIPKDLTVYKTRSLEPFSLFKRFTGQSRDTKIPTYILSQTQDESFKTRLAKWVRSNIFIPDAKIGWIPFAIKTGTKIIAQEGIDLICTSSPPHSLQIIGRALQKKTGVKWLADFRDPWSGAFWQQDNQQTGLARYLNRKFETHILASADWITSVSPAIITKFRTIRDNNYSVLYNGFDTQDFENLNKLSSKKFRIGYFGHLGGSQNCPNLFAALSELCADAQEHIQIRFYGSIHSQVLKAMQQTEIEHCIELNAYLDHRAALNKMINSEMLLLVIPEVSENRGIITGKIFEYMASGNFVLAIGPKNGDAAELISTSKCGVMCDYHEDLRKILFTKYNEWRENKSLLKFYPEKIERYERKNLTGQLADLFNQLCD